jgi:SAM-dependent methyltransferase
MREDPVNTTIEYFDQNAERCFADAFTITERTNQDHFLSYIRPGGTILDYGCGSGRDAAYFRARGFEVVPTDGSREMCRLASDYLGTPVRVLEFNELDEKGRFDGIFASASIMHLEYEKLLEVFPKMARALHAGGILFVSFKYGETDGYLGKRYYTKMTEDRLARTLENFDEFELVEQGTFGNEHPDQPDFRWLYACLRKR